MPWHAVCNSMAIESPKLSSSSSCILCRSLNKREQELQHHRQEQLRHALASECSPPGVSHDEHMELCRQNNQILGIDKGVWIASGLIAAWATMIHITVFHTPLHSLQAVALCWPMMQLHTGCGHVPLVHAVCSVNYGKASMFWWCLLSSSHLLSQNALSCPFKEAWGVESAAFRAESAAFACQNYCFLLCI